MNKKDRKELDKAVGLIDEAKEIIDSVMNGEQEKFDNLSEGLQQSEMGQKLEANVSNLENAIDNLDAGLEEINTAIE